MKRLFLVIFFWLSLVQLQASPLTEFEVTYAGLLKEYLQPHAEKQGIRLTMVDYYGWSQDPNHIQAMNKLKAIDPKQLSSDEAMVFWINAYNLLTVDLIISSQEKESIKQQGGLFANVWKKHSWPLFDDDYSLHQIEHEILREMGDARIHFAINCASLSCPDLRNEPYKAELLDWQLEDQEKAFILNPTKGVLITGATRETEEQISISAIFSWYKEDFGGRQGVQTLIHKYRDYDLTKAKLRTLPYDWSLNGDW